MRSPPYSKLLNAAWYQLLWFTAVLGGSALVWLLGLLTILHLGSVASWRREVTLIALVSGIGVCCDGLLATAGFFEFADDHLLPIPLWHLFIWIGFAATLRHSLQFMVERPRLMALAAAIGAPLTYLAAQRLGAVVFPFGDLPTAIVIGLCWLSITPLLVRLAAVVNGEELLPVAFKPLTLRTQETRS